MCPLKPLPMSDSKHLGKLACQMKGIMLEDTVRFKHGLPLNDPFYSLTVFCIINSHSPKSHAS